METIVITDYPKVLNRDLNYEIQRITSILGEVEVRVVRYENRNQWLNKVQDASALLTAFLPIDYDIMEAIPNLKCIALNASGYSNVDVDEATKRGIAVIPIEEYCTEEVAEHTIAMLLALARGMKHYQKQIEETQVWQYSSIKGLHRVAGATLGIAGFGKIGKRVGKIAEAMGMRILVYSPTGKTSNTESYPVTFVSKDLLLQESDFITNHMAVDDKTSPFFDETAFQTMARQPFFLNMGRGAAVDEKALVKALDMGWIKGAGLDVLSSECPNLEENPLVGRENVILTPHSAFYSEESLRLLQDISCDNLCYYLKGELEKVHRVVNF